MSILEKLRKDKVQAMKDKDKLRIGVISLMMSSIALAEKEKKKTLEDEEALEFIKRKLKRKGKILRFYSIYPICRDILQVNTGLSPLFRRGSNVL